MGLFRRFERVVRYGGVGAAMALLYSGLTAGLVMSRIIAWPIGASLAASLVVIPISFLTHRAITYRDTTYAPVQWLRFSVIAAATLAINVGLVALAGPLHAPYWAALVVGWFVVPLATYFINGLWVFRTRRLFAVDRAP